MPDQQHAALAAMLNEVCQAVGADAGGTLYLDDGDGTLLLAASSGTAGSGLAGVVRRLSGGAGKRDRRTLVLPIGGAGDGVAVLKRKTGAEFTQQDRAVARLYARRFSDDGVVAKSAVGMTGWTRQLEAIQRIAARLTRLASVEEVATTICTETREVIDHDEAHILVLDAAGMLQRGAATGPMRSGDSSVPPLPSDGSGAREIWAAVRSGAPALLPEVDDLGPSRPGPHSMLIVPLRYESRVNGVICLVANGRRHFDDDDLRLMQILSDQAAVAIENARLLHGRDELVRELAGLLEISEAAGAADDEKTLAKLLAARVRQQTGTDAALVARWDEGSTVMRVICRDGVGGTAEMIDVAESAARRQVLGDGRPVILQADSGDGGVETAQLRQVGASTLVLLPLNAGARTIGMVELLALREPRNPSPAEMQACEAMASLAAAGLEKVRVLEKLRSAADIDLVTGVHNHRYLQERLRQEIARSARSHAPLAVLMLDLDKFKPINDRFGHSDGDRVLHNVATTIRAQVRTIDIVARYGGDEFVVLMPDTSDSAAEQVARRVVAGVSHQRHALSDGSHVTVGISAGLAVYPSDGRNSAQLLQAADAAMYSAKRDGGRQLERSRVTGSLDMGEPLTARATA
ncbi:MAG TPA: diguanylate cyclase [Candidatus Limnocylindrales bacterium]